MWEPGGTFSPAVSRILAERRAKCYLWTSSPKYWTTINRSWPNWTDDPSLNEKSVELGFCATPITTSNIMLMIRQKSNPHLNSTDKSSLSNFITMSSQAKLGFFKHHLVPRESVIANLEQAGYTFSKEYTFLPHQYSLEFKRS